MLDKENDTNISDSFSQIIDTYLKSNTANVETVAVLSALSMIGKQLELIDTRIALMYEDKS